MVGMNSSLHIGRCRRINRSGLTGNSFFMKAGCKVGLERDGYGHPAFVRIYAIAGNCLGFPLRPSTSARPSGKDA